MTTLNKIRKIVLAAGFGFAVLIAMTADVNAQSRRDIERERQRIERENERYQREQKRVERENARYQREQRRYRSDRNDSVVSRRMEQRVADANYANGYQQGLLAGEYDRRKRKYNLSNVYRDTGSYPNDGDPTSSDYIYRQGYLQGYNDGYNGLRNY